MSRAEIKQRQEAAFAQLPDRLANLGITPLQVLMPDLMAWARKYAVANIDIIVLRYLSDLKNHYIGTCR